MSQFWIVTDNVVCQNTDKLGFSSLFVKTSFTDLQGSRHSYCGYSLIPGLQCDWSKKVCKNTGFGSFGRWRLILPRVTLIILCFLQSFSDPLLLVRSSRLMSRYVFGLTLHGCSYCRLWKYVALM